jgi:hypothetical protein
MKVEQLLRGKERAGTCGRKLTGKKKEPREEEEREKRDKERGKILPNYPDLLRFERYRSCSLLLPPCSSNPELKMMKDP